MCPACLGSLALWVAAGAGSAGGLVVIYRRKRYPEPHYTPPSKPEVNNDKR